MKTYVVTIERAVVERINVAISAVDVSSAVALVRGTGLLKPSHDRWEIINEDIKVVDIKEDVPFDIVSWCDMVDNDGEESDGSVQVDLEQW